VHDDNATSSDGRPVIGYREYVAFPEWGINHIRAKVDTGARTSAIHVDHVEDLGEGRVRFDVVLKRTDPPEKYVPVEAELVRTSTVKPSTGKTQQRPVVRAMIHVGPVRKEIEISLVSRPHMTCRMLLGRTALGGDFLIDASLDHTLGRPKVKKRRRAEETS
jgi:hypothetical protein